MPEWVVGRLSRHHQRAAFDCGSPLLNDWLRAKASQFERKDLARTYVACREGSADVLGYYALATHRVVFADLPTSESKGLPAIDIPVVLLGRLAVDRGVQGRGLGSALLVDALRRVLLGADEIGIRAVEVHAIDGTAKKFYLKYGFRELLDDSQHLFMPLHEIRKLNFDG